MDVGRLVGDLANNRARIARDNDHVKKNVLMLPAVEVPATKPTVAPTGAPVQHRAIGGRSGSHSGSLHTLCTPMEHHDMMAF